MIYQIEQHIPRSALVAFCRKHHVRKLALFGSAQRGELKPDSDIDFLIEFEEEHIPGLFDLSRMEIELTDLLGQQVDLRTPEELRRHFRDEVIRTAVVQYENICS